MRLAAIVPTLNEAPRLPALLAQLRPEVDDIVVVDGGSIDGTPESATAEGIPVVRSAPGRGRQLNAGARGCTADLLWFVHADSEIPRGLGLRIRAASHFAPWGCCAVRILDPDPRLRWTGWVMNQRARLFGSCTGDMGIWARRDFFETLGGFAELPLFEDLEFSDRAVRSAKPIQVNPALGTSARRWRKGGIDRTIVRMLTLRAGYRAGLPPTFLARWYIPENPG